MKMLGEKIDATMAGETEVDPKTKERVPKKSLATKTYEGYVAAKKGSPKKFREMYSLDALERLHELSLRRAKKRDVPTVKELIKLEEKSVRMPTIKEILRDRPLEEETAEGDVTEVEEEEKEAEEEPGEIE